MGDRGQATPLMVAALGLVALMLLAIGPMGRALSDRAQARTAADAAALAGAAEDEAAARAIADDNGADLVSFERDGAEVTVKVSVDGVSAHSRARARQVPSRRGAAGAIAPGDQVGLAPAMLAALQRAEELLGEPIPVTSGYRSPERQRELWEQRHTNPFPVAPPGRSKHERGLAVDVPSGFVGRLLEVADQVGLCQTLPVSDPIHFELCGVG